MNGSESRTIKKAEHQELMLSKCDAREDSWEFSDCMEIKPVNPKGNQPWIFIGRTDAEAETPILWPPDEKNRLIGKDPDAGKDWGQEEKGVAEDEMVRWHHQLSGHEYGQTQGDGEGQGGLACCGSWGHKDLDTTERLNHKQFTCILTGAARISGREPSENSGTSHGLWQRCLGPQLHLECCKYTTDGALVKVLRYSCRELQVKQKLSLWFLYFSSFSTLYLYNTSALWFEHIYFYYTLDSTLFAYITFHSILVYLIKLSSSVSCLDSGTDRYSLRANLRQVLRRTPVSWKRHYLVWVDALHLSLCRLQFP